MDLKMRIKYAPPPNLEAFHFHSLNTKKLGFRTAIMSDVVDEDVVEQILMRSDVKDLFRFKSVCKSWHSLITSSRFIKGHLNCSYNKDRHHSEHAHRRIILAHEFPGRYEDNEFFNQLYNCYVHHHLVGSSNGLVCILSFITCRILVGNPMTREVRQLKLPDRVRFPLCWGFGYDSCGDDYKVILGAPKSENSICLRVMSMKTGVWKVTREMKYAFIRKDGVLCNGALHWIVKDENVKDVLVAFDLSKEEFIEIPQPDDARYEYTYHASHLGIINECLCIHQRPQRYIWLMNKYKVKQSWELRPYDRELMYKIDIVHNLRAPMDDNILESVFHPQESWVSRYNQILHVTVPIFVQSLVSPHVDGRRKRAVNRLRSKNKRAPHSEAVEVSSMEDID